MAVAAGEPRERDGEVGRCRRIEAIIGVTTTIDHVNSVLIIDGSEPLAVVPTTAPADAAALRDGAINPASLAMNVMIGTVWGGEGGGKWGPMRPDFSGTVVNHSDKPLRAIEIKVQVRECPKCYVIDEWSRKFNINVPPGQQRNFGLREAWRIKRDGKLYTWQLITASACQWRSREFGAPDPERFLVCP